MNLPTDMKERCNCSGCHKCTEGAPRTRVCTRGVQGVSIKATGGVQGQGSGGGVKEPGDTAPLFRKW